VTSEQILGGLLIFIVLGLGLLYLVHGGGVKR
jgi:hypothetical protein